MRLPRVPEDVIAVQILFIDRSNFITVRLFTGDVSIDSDQNKLETAALITLYCDAFLYTSHGTYRAPFTPNNLENRINTRAPEAGAHYHFCEQCNYTDYHFCEQCD